MPEQNAAYISSSLLAIHSIITRGIKVSIESAEEFSRQNFSSTKGREGFINYVRAFVAVVSSHHLTEDELAFPYFKDKLPEAPFQLLSSQHKQMIPILGEIASAADRCQNENQVGTGLTDLGGALKRIDQIWQPHIKVEENAIVSKVDTLLPAEEQLRLVKLWSEHSAKHSDPPYLTVPFMLYNLPPEVRQIFAAGMPAEVTQNLVPVVWKEKWESMIPFLLQ
jgi:hemerythrin-like domain-containing protein